MRDGICKITHHNQAFPGQGGQRESIEPEPESRDGMALSASVPASRPHMRQSVQVSPSCRFTCVPAHDKTQHGCAHHHQINMIYFTAKG